MPTIVEAKCDATLDSSLRVPHTLSPAELKLRSRRGLLFCYKDTDTWHLQEEEWEEMEEVEEMDSRDDSASGGAPTLEAVEEAEVVLDTMRYLEEESMETNELDEDNEEQDYCEDEGEDEENMLLPRVVLDDVEERMDEGDSVGLDDGTSLRGAEEAVPAAAADDNNDRNLEDQLALEISYSQVAKKKREDYNNSSNNSSNNNSKDCGGLPSLNLANNTSSGSVHTSPLSKITLTPSLHPPPPHYAPSTVARNLTAMLEDASSNTSNTCSTLDTETSYYYAYHHARLVGILGLEDDHLLHHPHPRLQQPPTPLAVGGQHLTDPSATSTHLHLARAKNTKRKSQRLRLELVTRPR